MSKSSKEQIGLDEKKVIEELERNSKKSIDKIGRDCGFSRQKVWRVIKRLEKNKTIWGYHAVIDNDKLGLQQYYILIKRTTKPFSKEYLDLVSKRKIESEVAKDGIIVDSVLYVNGAFDWIHVIRASNILKVKKYCEVLNNACTGFISDIKVLEEMFPIVKNNVGNPNVKELEEMFL